MNQKDTLHLEEKNLVHVLFLDQENFHLIL